MFKGKISRWECIIEWDIGILRYFFFECYDISNYVLFIKGFTGEYILFFGFNDLSYFMEVENWVEYVKVNM